MFTDLDPLGTGTSKPFVDKKDFFNTPKKGLKMTGASNDSLNNVGLNMSDPFFVDPNLGLGISESNFTNSLLSSSSIMSSSRFSDSLWSNSITPRTAGDTQNTPAPALKIQNEAWDSQPPMSQQLPHYATTHRNTTRTNPSSNLSCNTLRVALPPEETTRRSTSPGINHQSSNTYGSILELEASPRRFRKYEIPDFYTAREDSLAFTYGAGSGKYDDMKEFDSLGSHEADMSLNIPMPAEPPPALPQRPPKLSSVSPPPLPPKKQSVMMGTSVFSQQRQTPATRLQPDSKNDIYDFIHENTNVAATPEPTQPPPLPSKENDIPVEELVKMSVVELSQRMLDGKLPNHLTGMSLFELVEYVSKQTRDLNESKSQEQLDIRAKSGIEMKPSFSDNFEPKSTLIKNKIEDQLVPSFKYSGISINTDQPESQLYHNHEETRSLSSNKNENESLHRFGKTPGSDKPLGAGFEDDFSRLPMSTSTSSNVQESSMDQSQTQFDKYAVFRELQMEEEISNAWKSPTEEAPVQEDAENVNETEFPPEVSDDAQDIFVEAVEDVSEPPNYAYEDDFHETSGIPTINVENSATNEGFEEISNDQPYEQSDVLDVMDINSSLTMTESESSHTKVGNGQAIILDTSFEALEASNVIDNTFDDPTVDNPAFDDNFGNSCNETVPTETIDHNNPVTSDKNGWATFEDEQNFEFSSFLSKEEQNRLLNKSPVNKNEKPDLFDWNQEGQESAFQPRSQSTDPTQDSIKPKRFDPFSNRPGTEPPREWSSSAWNDGLNVDEAFPSSASSSKGKSQSSLKMSNDSIFNNPFADNFVNNDRDGVPATPPVFEGVVPCDRDSNTSRQSCASTEFVDTLDVFDENNSFSNSNFKIQAKTSKQIPNSESVDIFKVSADPFDDDFFK